MENIKNSLIFTAFFIASLVVCELALRQFAPVPIFLMDVEGPLSEFTGWGPTTDGDGNFLCDNTRRPNAERRVLLLGDSMLDCNVTGTQPFNSTIPHFLQSILGDNYDVYNISAGGWGTDQEYLGYKKLGASYKPDWVLLFYTPANDLFNNSSPKAIDEDLTKPQFELVDGRLTIRSPIFLRREQNRLFRWAMTTEIGKRFLLLNRKYGEQSKNKTTHSYEDPKEDILETEPFAHTGPFFKPLLPRFEKSWQVTKAIISKLQKEVEASGSRFGVVYLPVGIRNPCAPLPDYPTDCIGYQTDQDLSLNCQDRQMKLNPYHQYDLLAKFGQEQGFPVIGPFEYFTRLKSQSDVAPDCIHYNADAALAVSRIVGDFLSTSGVNTKSRPK